VTTPIATMVERMLGAGIPHDIIVLAVRTAELSGCRKSGIPVEFPVDFAAEKRREWDRNRKRQKVLSGGIPVESGGIPQKPLLIEESIKISKRKGERIPPEWKPSDEDLSYATSKGMPRSRIDLEAEKFRNYWTAKTGTAATKVDWPATWRNWVLSSLERVPGEQPSTVVQLKQTEHGEPTATGFYLMDGTPERDAWDQFDREAGRIPRPRDRRGGWNFPTKWPEEMQKSEGRNG